MTLKLPLATAAALALTVSAIGGTATVALSKGSPATIKTRHTAIGTVLVDAKGRTAYRFAKDPNNMSRCSGRCAVDWPPVLTSGKPKAANGASAARLGTTKRAGGTTQVTYAGHPLYLFVGDQGTPGSTKGEGLSAFGAKWYAVTAAGKKVVTGGGGY